jgi:hypothetical protein
MRTEEENDEEMEHSDRGEGSADPSQRIALESNGQDREERCVRAQQQLSSDQNDGRAIRDV